VLENKLSGSPRDEHAAQNALPTAAPPIVPMASGYNPAAPTPYGKDKQPMKADYPPASRPTGAGDDETSFSNSRPPTSSSYHGARPKTAKADDDADRPGSRRQSLALPFIAE